MMLRRVVFAFLFALAPSAHAREPVTQAQLAEAATELDAARASFNTPSLAVAIVADGKVVMAQGFGRRGLDDPAPVDADTRFAIGSCSKAFTSFGIGLLVDDGRVRFSDLVRAHDPRLALSQPGAIDRLTIANLLSQRSGLARHDFIWHAIPGMSRGDFAAAQGLLAMQATPGTRFGYTNSAYILAGRVIDLDSGQPWETFTTQRIFAPLGMTRSNFSSAGLGVDANAAQATKRADGSNRTVAWRDGRLLGPAGAINTTAHDMGRWLLLLAGHGVIDGRTLISPATLDTLWTPVIGPERRPRGGDDDDGGYAMGWRVDTWRDHRRISHSGAVDGFRARVTLFPDEGIAIAVMANLGPSHLPDFATRRLAERLLDLPHKTDLAKFAAIQSGAELRALTVEAPAPRGRTARLGVRDTTIAPAQPLSALEGIYRHAAYGEVRIERTADGHSLRIVFGTLAGRLDPWRGDSFISFSDRPDDTLDEGEFVFRTDAAGAVSGLTAMIDNDIAPIPFARVGPLPAMKAAVAPDEAQLTSAPGSVDHTGTWALRASGAAVLLLLGLGVFWLRRERA